MQAFRDLDRVLRGDAKPGDAGVTVALAPLLRINVALAASYGVCTGVYGLCWPDGAEWRQMASAAVKVPALFLLTLAVTFPSLYVFNTLLGSRLRLGELARLVLAALSVLVAVLSAFGPITAFFSVTTVSYPFVVLLNVTVFAVSGAFGLGALHKALRDLSRTRVVEEKTLAATGGPGHRVIYAWMLLFSLVGGQMAWVLRPFIGSPEMPFAWLRPREGSFFEGVARAAKQLLGLG